jgi:2',3'-cyclic-nucleotide 2'-phosphodiesterase / 3'-nucleotidase / 5'-nucleotidase
MGSMSLKSRIGLSAMLILAAAPMVGQIRLTPMGVFAAGGNAAAEIPAYDRFNKRVFSVNGAANRVDAIDVRNPQTPVLAFTMNVGGAPTSIAVEDRLVAVAVEGTPKTSPGTVKFFDTNGVALGQATVGALPDMVVFTPGGRRLLVANEGEPSSYGRADSVDPEGSVSIIEIPTQWAPGVPPAVRTARFSDSTTIWNRESVRIYGPNATLAQDMEPEYIAVSKDGTRAWVTLQENNAIAVLDINNARFDRVIGLGFKDHSVWRNKLDASDRDNGINIQNWPVKGMYQPDAIAAYEVNGTPLLVMANEGDARDYTGFAEEARVGAGSYLLDANRFPAAFAAQLKDNARLGRLTVSTATGDTDKDGDFDEIMVLGGRSFTIRDGLFGDVVYDSADEIEQITAAQAPAKFNSQGTAADFDTRSDNKGPEPEGVALGVVEGCTYAFIGLERTGGVMVYNITNPLLPIFVQYADSTGDLAPEGLAFVPAADSPTLRPMLVVSNEVSGTVRLFDINNQAIAGFPGFSGCGKPPVVRVGQ